MAGKDFSLMVKVLLNSAGFTTGKNKVSQDAKALERGVTASNTAIKNSFAGLTNGVLPQFGQQFGDLGGAFGGVGTALKSLLPAFTGLKSAIISTGVGAIIIVITTAIAGLIGWMKRTDEGGDTMRKVFDVIKAVIDVVLTKITFLGSAIVKLFKGDFKGAGEDAKQAFTGWGQAMKENIATANELNEVQDKLEDYNETYATKRANLEERISELQLKARDEEAYSAKERLAYNDQLKKSKLELFNLENGQKQLEYNALKKEIELGADNQDNRQKINEKEAELIQLRTTYNQGLRETLKLNNKLQDDVKKQTEDEALATAKQGNKVGKANTSGLEVSNLAPAIQDQLAPMKTYMADATQLWKNYEKGAIGAFKLIKGQGKLTFKEIANQALDLGSIIAGGTLNAVNALGDALGNLFTGSVAGFKDVVTVALQTIQQIIQALLAQAIAAMIAKESSKGLIGLAFAAVGVAGLLALWQSKVPAFAAGGTMQNSGWALVGEQGPELAQLSSGTRIYNNFQTRNMLGGTPNGTVLVKFQDGALQGKMDYDNRRRNSSR